MTAGSAVLTRIEALHGRAHRGMVLGLERTREALAELGDPHAALRCVHVAGSNGKGSVAATVEAMARASGLRTGLYTSPHLCRYAERIRLGGAPIDDDAFARALDRVLGARTQELTFFESLTVAAFVAFRDAGVELAILEVGLGGRLDATNVIEAPLATAITSISLEHTDWLGDSIAAIAREKAGILKRDAPVVLGRLPDEASAVIAEIAREVGAGPIEHDVATIHGDLVEVKRGASTVRARPALAGAHQAGNAAVACGIGWAIGLPEAAMATGIETVSWPGRLERIARGDRTVVLDCAHNLEGAAALAAALGPVDVLVFGALADKKWSEMLIALGPSAARIVYTSPKGRAPAPLAELAAILPGEAVADPAAAVARALELAPHGGVVVVTGSSYLVGEVRGALFGLACDPPVAL